MPLASAEHAEHRRRSRGTWIGGVVVGVMALLWFGFDLGAEPSFIDEWAYISQAYFGPLWWHGQWNDTAWLEYPAIDLPPLPKYLIAASLRIGDLPIPDRADALAWYEDTHRTFGGREVLVWSRCPSVLLGALGCVGLYAIGTLSFGPWTGALASLLLMINPLYQIHARRAMSDVPTEALTLLALAVGLWAWRDMAGGRRLWRGAAAMSIGAGLLAGLAVLAKLSGALAMMVLSAWAVLTLALPGINTGRRAAVVGSIAVAGVVAFSTFVIGNPIMTADPQFPKGTPEPVLALAEMNVLERAREVQEFRRGVSRAGQEHRRFKAQGYALTGPVEKLSVVAVQGFGRFGPLGPSTSDSLIRYDWTQDRGALVWGPLVLAGIGWSAGLGHRQIRSGELPTVWAVLSQFLVATITVTAFIPLAWDRYLLPIQSGAALLASGFVVGAIRGVSRAVWRGRPPR